MTTLPNKVILDTKTAVTAFCDKTQLPKEDVDEALSQIFEKLLDNYQNLNYPIELNCDMLCSAHKVDITAVDFEFSKLINEISKKLDEHQFGDICQADEGQFNYVYNRLIGNNIILKRVSPHPQEKNDIPT